jgi:hypothetical protein
MPPPAAPHELVIKSVVGTSIIFEFISAAKDVAHKFKLGQNGNVVDLGRKTSFAILIGEIRAAAAALASSTVTVHVYAENADGKSEEEILMVPAATIPAPRTA